MLLIEAVEIVIVLLLSIFGLVGALGIYFISRSNSTHSHPKRHHPHHRTFTNPRRSYQDMKYQNPWQ